MSVRCCSFVKTQLKFKLFNTAHSQQRLSKYTIYTAWTKVSLLFEKSQKRKCAIWTILKYVPYVQLPFCPNSVTEIIGFRYFLQVQTQTPIADLPLFTVLFFLAAGTTGKMMANIRKFILND